MEKIFYFVLDCDDTPPPRSTPFDCQSWQPGDEDNTKGKKKSGNLKKIYPMMVKRKEIFLMWRKRQTLQKQEQKN